MLVLVKCGHGFMQPCTWDERRYRHSAHMAHIDVRTNVSNYTIPNIKNKLGLAIRKKNHKKYIFKIINI